jgi:hypothetical protein
MLLGACTPALTHPAYHPAYQVTGSLDYTVRLYDFNGMKADLRAFRSLEPCEGHPVLAVSWSPTGVWGWEWGWGWGLGGTSGPL